MNITININAPELASAIQALAAALSANKGFAEAAAGIAPVTPPSALAPAAPSVVPMPAMPSPTSAAPSVAPAPAAPATVPTVAPSYSLDQLAVAATQLVDAGRREELVQLLASFGVQALTALPKEQYGAFATQLRAMGAKI